MLLRPIGEISAALLPGEPSAAAPSAGGAAHHHAAGIKMWRVRNAKSAALYSATRSEESGSGA